MNIQQMNPYDGRGPFIRVFQVPRTEIGFMTSVCEVSDGIGLIRTLDKTRGIIECWIMPDSLSAFETMIDSLRKQFPIQAMEEID